MFRAICDSDDDVEIVATPQSIIQQGSRDLLLASPELLSDPEDEIDGAQASNGTPKRTWLLTIFTGNRSIITRSFKELEDHCKFYSIGFEVCPTTKRDHCHAAVCMKEPVRLSYWRKFLDPKGFKWNAKFCLQSKFRNFINYTKKEDSNPILFGEYVDLGTSNRNKAAKRKEDLDKYRALALEGRVDQIPENEYRPHHRYYEGLAKKGKYDQLYGEYRDYLEKEWENRSFKSWQRAILNEIEGPPDNRTILWVYDSQGGAGKSSFAKYLELKRDAQCIIPAKTADIAFALKPGMSLYILDIPRTMGEHVPWGFLESLKNGLYLNPKYESQFIHMKPPHIIVMCNAPPPEVNERQGFSEDRIKLFTI